MGHGQPLESTKVDGLIPKSVRDILLFDSYLPPPPTILFLSLSLSGEAYYLFQEARFLGC